MENTKQIRKQLYYLGGNINSLCYVYEIAECEIKISSAKFLSDVFTCYTHYQLIKSDFANLNPIRVTKSNFDKYISKDNNIQRLSVKGNSFDYKLSTDYKFKTLWKDIDLSNLNPAQP